MPIEGISNIIRMPCLGKIRLGIKMEGKEGKNPYPRQTDYLVCPKEVQTIYGEQPTRLSILFPTENPEHWAQQWLRCYSLTKGLVCRGDGKTARRLFDVETGAIAGRGTTETVIRPVDCIPGDCEEYPRRCRRVMNLQFFLPDVPGFGVWQIDTSSFNSIVNVNSSIDMIRAICGRIAMIPLALTYGPMEVIPPGGTRKTVHVLNVTADKSLAVMQRLALIPAARILLPPPDTERPEDFFPAEVIAETEEGEVPPVDMTPPGDDTKGPPEQVVYRDVEKITTISAAQKACYEDFGLQPQDVLREAGYSSALDVSDPQHLYLTIASVRGVRVSKLDV